MKEISLQELLNMADAAAHDGIGDLWNQKTIHYLVVFTSEDEDFEIIGAGPTLPCATLDAATAHSIPGKKPEFFVKCPGALAGRLLPKLAPGLGMRPAPPAAIPSLKGRTSVPFPHSPPPATPSKPEETASKDEEKICVDTEQKISAAPPTAQIPSPPPAIPAPARMDIPADLVEREKAIKQREQELALLAENLKAREAVLRDREAAIAAFEERLLNPPRGHS